MTCPAAERLHQQLLKLGWETRLTYARGPVEFTELSATPRGDGTRPRVTVTRELDSALIRACHPRRQHDENAWALVALWIQDGVTEKGALKWACDLAYIPGEHTPQRIGATAVRTYLASFSNPTAAEEAA